MEMNIGALLVFSLACVYFSQSSFGFPDAHGPVLDHLRRTLPPIHSPTRIIRRQNSTEPANGPSSSPRVNFQVMQPPVVPIGGKSCVVTLIQNTFGSTYGKPAKTKYLAPTTCGKPGSWAAVILNLTVTSQGTQYDRLINIFLNQVEIMRTSTAEPIADGIIWTVTKDITKYMPLLAASDGELVMNLDNVIDESIGIDGAFVVNLSFKYYEPTNAFAAPPAADLILPISKSGAQMFSENPAVTSITIPENTASAFVEIYASGAAKEEFWYTNALDEAIPILASHSNTSVTGKGPYREVQLLIDNKLAGVVLPFPVIFTGGIILSWWSPMVAYGAFDLPTYLLDITPFIPTLTDGKAHNFTLAVEGLGANRSINGNFFLSGNLALITDRAGGRTTGKITKYENTPRLKTSAGLCKDGLRTVIEAGRVISISSDVITGSGTKKVDFSQTMVYKSTQIWNLEGKGQQVKQISSGSIVSTTNGNRTFSEKFNYPLGLTLKSEKDSLVGKLKLRYNRVLQSTSFVGLGNNIDTNQIAKGSLKLESPGRASSGFGETEQIFKFSDARGSTYFRNVAVSNPSTCHLSQRTIISFRPLRLETDRNHHLQTNSTV